MKERSREMGSSGRTAEEIFRDHSGRRTDAVHDLTNERERSSKVSSISVNLGYPLTFGKVSISSWFSPGHKKKEGNAARYVTRSQAVKQLQVSLPFFRKLCILKGVFPWELKKKVKGNHHTYYHLKDVSFIQHEPLLEQLREIRAYERKVKRADAKKNKERAALLKERRPTYKLDRIILQRCPKFVDTLRDIDDCLSY